MENTTSGMSGAAESRKVDPAADLAVLRRAKESVDIGQVLDFGPAWYAPMVATMLAAITLFGQEFVGDWSFVYAAVGIGTGAIVSVHDFRRRKVRQRPSVRSAAATIPIVLGSFVVLAAWGTAVSSIGYERFMPGYAVVGWLVTTGLLLAVRSVLNGLSSRRSAIA